MSEFVLEAKERKTSDNLHNLRTQGRVPGTVYGAKVKALNIDVEYNALLKILTTAGTSNIVTIKAGDKNVKAIVREYQQDPVTDKLTHVDFLVVDDKHFLTTVVPLEFVGESRLVKEQGAKLNFKNEKVNVKCLPGDLPATIKVDVSVLQDMGQTISISQLEVSDKVEILNNPNDPVVNVTMPKKIKIETPVEEAPAEGEEGAEGEAPAEGEAKPEEGKEAPKEGEAKPEEKPAEEKK